MTLLQPSSSSKDNGGGGGGQMVVSKDHASSKPNPSNPHKKEEDVTRLPYHPSIDDLRLKVTTHL